MSIDFNLLPPDLFISKNLSRALKTVRALGVISIAAFLVFAIGVGAYFVFSTITLNGLTKNIDQLKTKVTAQETSEQQIILLKDRLTYIAAAKSSASALNNIINSYDLLSGLSGDSVVSRLNASSGNIDLLMVIKSNTDLSSFMQSVESSNFFKSVVLSSFSYNPAGGYVVGLNLVGK